MLEASAVYFEERLGYANPPADSKQLRFRDWKQASRMALEYQKPASPGGGVRFGLTENKILQSACAPAPPTTTLPPLQFNCTFEPSKFSIGMHEARN